MWLSIGVLSDDGAGKAIIERVVDLHSLTVPWAQQLWRTNALQALRHCAALAESGARDRPKSWSLKYARDAIASDPNVPPAERGFLLRTLSINAEKLVPGSTSLLQLELAEGHLSENYWDWMIGFFNSKDDTQPVASSGIDIDQAAWRIGSLLRSAGLSDRWVVNYFSYHLNHNAKRVSVADVLVEAREVARGEPGWVFLVPLESARGYNIPSTPPFLPRRDFEDRFKTEFPTEPMPSNRGGLELRPDTIDKYAAIEWAEREVRALLNRHNAAGNRRILRPVNRAWVLPGAWQTELSFAPQSRVRLPSLDAFGGGQLFHPASDEVEAATDLLIAADMTSERAACVATWSVLETLFADESDFGDLASIADRAADILVCLYVRDAYERLAVGHSRGGNDALADELRSSARPRRAELIAESLGTRGLAVNSTLGAAAIQTALQLKQGAVAILHQQLATALRRLYDVRNQIVHAGVVAPYGLQSVYYDSVVLVSGLLSEVHAQYQSSGTSARRLAASASWHLGRVRDGISPVWSLSSL
ncbi:hypothetical protein FHX33_000331 [Leifsonia aquatica]|nr:hypothetical protein [Leifsonia aquatica]